MAPGNEAITATQVARIAVYDDFLSAPRVIDIQPTDVATYIENIASATYKAAADMGGSVPYTVIREVSENFIHAHFKEVTVSVLDHGCTIRFADQGPGIENKDRAQLPGFTSATSDMKDFIRGVGSGLPIVKEYLKFSNGRLVIEDNIKDGTVITIAVDPKAGREPVIYQEAPVVSLPVNVVPSIAQAQAQAQQQMQQQGQMQVKGTNPATTPAFMDNAADVAAAPKQLLDQRDLEILALATEMNVGPTDVHEALDISTATAYRVLDKLQKAGYLMSDTNHKGKRILTQLGLQALREQE